MFVDFIFGRRQFHVARPNCHSIVCSTLRAGGGGGNTGPSPAGRTGAVFGVDFALLAVGRRRGLHHFVAYVFNSNLTCLFAAVSWADRCDASVRLMFPNPFRYMMPRAAGTSANTATLTSTPNSAYIDFMTNAPTAILSVTYKLDYANDNAIAACPLPHDFIHRPPIAIVHPEMRLRLSLLQIQFASEWHTRQYSSKTCITALNVDYL